MKPTRTQSKQSLKTATPRRLALCATMFLALLAWSGCKTGDGSAAGPNPAGL
jgi:hypothetical protein